MSIDNDSIESIAQLAESSRKTQPFILSGLIAIALGFMSIAVYLEHERELSDMRAENLKKEVASLKSTLNYAEVLLRDEKQFDGKSGPDILALLAKAANQAQSLQNTSNNDSGVPAIYGNHHYDWPMLNAQAVQKGGWSVDVFACHGSSPAGEAGILFAKQLGRDADSGKELANTPIGRVRLVRDVDWSNANVIGYDPAEKNFAVALAREVFTATGITMNVAPNPSTPTYHYLSVYFCGK